MADSSLIIKNNIYRWYNIGKEPGCRSCINNFRYEGGDSAACDKCEEYGWSDEETLKYYRRKEDFEYKT